jgi:hypothetical protein
LLLCNLHRALAVPRCVSPHEGGMKKAMTVLDQFTLTTVPLEQYFNETRLGQGTGFMWKIQEQYYLVTNWHVLSMRDFFTRANLRKDAGRPNILRTLFNIQTGSFDKQRWDITIRDDNDRPLWLVHPSRRVDIAVLPIPFRPKQLIIALYPLNVLANAALRIEIGMEVFILGYPFKIEPPASGSGEASHPNRSSPGSRRITCWSIPGPAGCMTGSPAGADCRGRRAPVVCDAS